MKVTTAGPAVVDVIGWEVGTNAVARRLWEDLLADLDVAQNVLCFSRPNTFDLGPGCDDGCREGKSMRTIHPRSQPTYTRHWLGRLSGTAMVLLFWATTHVFVP